METTETFIVKWKSADGCTESSYLTDNLEEAVETFRNNVRLGFEATIEAR